MVEVGTYSWLGVHRWVHVYNHYAHIEALNVLIRRERKGAVGIQHEMETIDYLCTLRFIANGPIDRKIINSQIRIV